MDTEYLKRNLGTCLTQCLSEVCEKRPKDPIEFIAHWLYKYVDNENFWREERKTAEWLQHEMAAYSQKKELPDGHTVKS